MTAERILLRTILRLLMIWIKLAIWNWQRERKQDDYLIGRADSVIANAEVVEAAIADADMET